MRGSYYNWFDYPGFEYAMLGVIVIALLAMLFMQASQNSGHTSSRTLLTNLHNNVFMYNAFLPDSASPPVAPDDAVSHQCAALQP